MIYKRIFLVVLVSMLGACTSMPSFMSQNTGSANPQTPASETPEDEAARDAASASEANLSATEDNGELLNQTQSPQETLAQALLAQTDLFHASKRTMAPSTKAKVIAVLEQFKKGEYVQSEQAIGQILNYELDLNSSVYVLAGDIALANNKENLAIAHYEQALSINEYNAKAANRLGKLMRQQGQFNQAHDLYTQAIHAQPSIAQSYRNRAVLFDLYLNNKTKALQDYERYEALLHYELALHDSDSQPKLAVDEHEDIKDAKPLSEDELKRLKADIKIAERWLIDVGRQVEALARSQNKNP
jgi:tetratricopeptide (TPR) repeat protein